MKALYRKYRPTRLEDVIGQPQVTEPLANSLKQGKISHAYLFIGPRGTGKTSVARILAHAVNGFDYQLEDSYLDIIEIDAASNNGVDDIRELREKAIIAPTKGKYKVYIIDEVHMLTKSASNALLKTLEEPPEHTIFIMATTEADKVPITISSRTQLFNFQLSSPEILASHLRKIADAEKFKITDDALALIARRGGGSFRDSLSILDQVVTLTNTEITADFLNSALGLPSDQMIEQLLSAYASSDLESVHTHLATLYSSGLSPENISRSLVEHILRHPISTYLPLLAKLPEVMPPFSDAKLLLALAPHTIPTPISTPVQKPTSAPSPISAPKPSPSPTPAAQPTTSGDFSWEDFLARVHDASDGTFVQLNRCRHELKNGALHLYSPHAFTISFLRRSKNTAILNQCLSGYELIIHDPVEPVSHDPTVSQISAIMGGASELPPEESPF